MSIIGKRVREARQSRLKHLLVYRIVEILQRSIVRLIEVETTSAARHWQHHIVHTGPVITLLDLVVHVPVNRGSVSAEISDTIIACATSESRYGRIMSNFSMSCNFSISTNTYFNMSKPQLGR